MSTTPITFVDAFSRYVSRSKHALGFWLNATGAKADWLEAALRARGAPFYRSRLLPLADLAGDTGDPLARERLVSGPAGVAKPPAGKHARPTGAARRSGGPCLPAK